MIKQIPNFNKVDPESIIIVRNDLCHSIAVNDGCENIACCDCVLNTIREFKEFLNGN